MNVCVWSLEVLLTVSVSVSGLRVKGYGRMLPSLEANTESTCPTVTDCIRFTTTDCNAKFVKPLNLNRT